MVKVTDEMVERAFDELHDYLTGHPSKSDVRAALEAALADVPEASRAALRRCFDRARGCSGGESRVRRLLFAWHNAVELGGFDLTDLWSLSDEWREDVLTVIAMVARGPQGWYAHEYGFGDEMQALIEEFGPKGES